MKTVPLDDPKAQEFWKARERRDTYFNAIRNMRAEYMAEYKGEYDLTVRPTLHYWAEQKYGFVMATDGAGNYTADYNVVDPKKFMMFQIKYWE